MYNESTVEDVDTSIECDEELADELGLTSGARDMEEEKAEDVEEETLEEMNVCIKNYCERDPFQDSLYKFFYVHIQTIDNNRRI